MVKYNKNIHIVIPFMLRILARGGTKKAPDIASGAFSPDFGEDSPNLSFDSQSAKKRQQGPVLWG